MTPISIPEDSVHQKAINELLEVCKKYKIILVPSTLSMPSIGQTREIIEIYEDTSTILEPDKLYEDNKIYLQESSQVPFLVGCGVLQSMEDK